MAKKQYLCAEIAFHYAGNSIALYLGTMPVGGF